MARRNRRGKKDGTMTDSADRGSGPSGGRGAHSGVQQTRPPLLVRPSGTSVEVNGLRYFDYNAAPVRQDKAQIVQEAISVDLLGRRHTNQLASSPQEVDIHALNRVDELWSAAYRQLVYMAESRDAYRHLPASLNEEHNFRYYIEMYMTAVSALTEWCAWNKLTQYDRGHREAGMASARISRGRINTLWQALTSYPMFPAFHQFAKYVVTPVTDVPSGAVLHRMNRPYQVNWGGSGSSDWIPATNNYKMMADFDHNPSESDYYLSLIHI